MNERKEKKNYETPPFILYFILAINYMDFVLESVLSRTKKKLCVERERMISVWRVFVCGTHSIHVAMVRVSSLSNVIACFHLD